MMRRTIIQEVTDASDQEIAQIVHRVGVDRVVLEMTEGHTVIFESAPEEEEGEY